MAQEGRATVLGDLRLGGGDGVRVAAWKFAGRSIMSLMNPQTQIKSWKLSAVNECDTRFRNNAKVRCITSVYTSASLLFPNRGRRGPKTNYRLSRSQYAYEGLPCITLHSYYTQERISLSLVDILFPPLEEGKVMYSSDRQRLCRASLIRNKLTERLVETIQRFHLHSFTLVSHSLETVSSKLYDS